ncbi:DNA polymerase Y family protein [Sphingobium lignivorans]|uniref:Protein ImuB n=1 Tax=Sphingobium lignivorans TaxID=2735886 RepID=A0ABR6NIY2_9SPHN|nr:protein ImuB [Sphingobium lignivorans]
MTRVASLFLPQLPIERLRRMERPSALLPEPFPQSAQTPLPPIDDEPGACSVPRGGGWRPGARWARDGALSRRPSQAEPDAMPAHQRPTMREMGRRSEAADNPFKAMRPDDGSRGGGQVLPTTMTNPWARPLILIERIGQKEVISAACPIAIDLGLRPGMPAAQARAQVTDLEVRDAEPDADRAVLDRLALHAVGHWTPTASVAGPDGLWLDLTGTTHLFGGEARFCQRLLNFLRRLGFTGGIAIAGTPGAAHALARFSGRATTILRSGQETQALADLPVAALRLSPAALVSAARFGLERVGDFYPMPRGPLARRFGLETVQRLDQARGLSPEPIVPVVPFEEPLVERQLLEPIGTAEAITQVIGDLVDDLVAVLQVRGLGLRTLVLSCTRVDSDEQRIGLGTARATRDARHLKRMLGLQIERIEPGLGIEAMRLRTPRVEDLQPEALGDPLGGETAAPDIALLVDQLSGRVGEEALFRARGIESDVPERAVGRAPPLSTPTGWAPWRRPVRLLARPEPLGQVIALLPDHPPRRFIWRRQLYTVVAGDGPERVHGEWWQRPGELWAVRDYFAVETQGGARFWIFRRGDGVEAPTGDLSWYMHGAFG